MKKFSVVFGVFMIYAAALLSAADSRSPALPLSFQKLVPAGHWIYDSLMYLALEQGEVSFVQNAPLSVAELKAYLMGIDYEKLTDSGKAQYERVSSYFRKTDGIFLRSSVISLGMSVSVTPELYFKTNDDIDWSFNYFYKDNVISAPVFLNVADVLCIESDVFFGKNYWAVSDAKNHCNIPLAFDQMEFLWPRTAYLSTGLRFADGRAGINFQLGRGAMSVGSTQMGSIFLSENFETEAYARLTLFSPRIRYTGDVIEVDVNKFLYLHRIEARPFKRFQLGVIEGTYVNAPLELRFMNPLMIMHSMSPWEGYGNYNAGQADGEAKTYGESRVCAYFGVTFDYAVCKNVRIYGVYAQNEIQIPPELDGPRGKMFPDSLGGQLGIEVKLPSAKKGIWITGLEGLYATPWLYIKHDPNWSLYRERFDNLENTKMPIASWIGTPFGPDTIAVQFRFGYEVPAKWSCEMQYRFAANGENGFNLFYNKDGSSTAETEIYKGKYTYYPVVGYDTGKYTEEQAIAIARETWAPTGIAEYSHRILLKGSYFFTERISLSGQCAYTIVLNAGHEEDNVQHGAEFVLSVTAKLF
ncbi:MAG: hypothetical protein NC041_04880 [Bacteroides sp.]|nr:hypothetical protein [Prevotella sp.]MCM1407294.1 hypothetical protein [Treponema brennaborense]MCM1469782.1 hypothetical protein [Bacteroides sp.]